jgi:hypothetical protein
VDCRLISYKFEGVLQMRPVVISGRENYSRSSRTIRDSESEKLKKIAAPQGKRKGTASTHRTQLTIRRHDSVTLPVIAHQL